MRLHIHSGGLGEVHHHLAVEDLLLEEAAPDRIDLYLYRCPPAVVIGKNQIPWRECRPGRLADRGIRLARRASGGGAVYHDPGNLNAAFVLPRSLYETGKVMRVFLDALSSLGVWAACPERSRLVWNDAKISGQAFAYRRDRVLHHGTLLLDTDLAALQDSLEPCAGIFESPAVASKPSPVRNLGLPVETVEQALVSAAERVFGLCAEPGGTPRVLLGAGADWDWLCGRSPDFTWRRPVAGAGAEPALLRVEKGVLRFCARGREAGNAVPAAGVRLERGAWRRFVEGLTPGLWPWVPGLFGAEDLPPE